MDGHFDVKKSCNWTILQVINNGKTKILNFFEKLQFCDGDIKNYIYIYFFLTQHISTSVQLEDLNIKSLERGEFGDYFGKKYVSLPSFVNEKLRKTTFKKNY